MTKHPNLDDRALLDLVEQHAGEDFLRELLSWALHKVMEAEVGEIAGAGKGERSPEERANLRNGYRRRYQAFCPVEAPAPESWSSLPLKEIFKGIW